MLSYAKLWMLLEKRGMKRTDLKEVISGNTLAKLGKNEPISSTVIEKICAYLDCQPGEIMEYVSEEKVKKVVKEFGSMQKVMIDSMKENGIGEDEFMALMKEALPQYMEQMFKGKNPLENLVQEATKKDSDSE